MMPASSSRPPPGHSLPPLDEATSVPFSSLFDSNHFDLATVEATAQLADRSIFVMPNGRRFLFESIPEPQNTRPNRSSPNAYPPQEEHQQPQVRPQPQPQPQPQQQPQPQPQLPTVQPFTPQQSHYQYHYPQPPQFSPPPPPTVSGPAQDLEALRRNHSPTIRRRPVSNASSNPYSPGGGRSPNPGGQHSASEPKLQTYEVTAMMANLDLQQTPRFGAAPLFDHSDGGVQAAEALIDGPYVGPKNEQSPGSHSSPSTPSLQHSYHDTTPTGRQSYSDHPPNTTHVTQIHSFNYPNYMAQAYQAQETARQAAATPSRPQYESLMEHSTPMASMTVTSEQYYASWSASPVSPQRETSDAQFLMTGGNSGASARDYPQPPPTAVSGRAASVSLSYQQSRHPSYSNAGGSYDYASQGFDTQTPVVVIDPEPQPERHPSSSSTMDSRSTGRDNIMPGEDLLYDGPVKSSNALYSPVFLDGQLKVFRNNITNDLRFHCKVGNDSETYWMRAADAQLVPVYAYDPRFPNVVFIRDKTEMSKSAQSPTMGLTTQGTTGRPSGIYQFNRLKELCDFQAKLTAEKVVLDIASVKLVRLCKAHSRSYETYSSVRLQVWHEAELRKDRQSDAVSFKTAGTALSGPLRERLVASSSRLVIYLGRLGEFINVFITDDYEANTDGPTMVKLKPRKASGLGKKGSRWPGIKAHIEPKQPFEMAGLDIHGQAPNIDVESRYELYKTFEIDFENSPSQDNFMRKWDEVMRERRAQRKRLHQIQEEMETAVFSGKKARELW
ncbi:hypothetical protein QBC37DRAFT_193947 [Rhypophila decipiens]|uniref:Uncharacterized protein n=1 Tax=Rhypophila decipiens TaxID=261697 RepID=A0AAN7B6R9_9PEZI|nr:hypothetical protein QBC37DRAFT_193947 [Rhypophila decipiens]